MALPTTLGERVRQARERAGMDQTDLANALGVHVKTVSKWENDRQSPNEAMLAALARVLKTEPAMLAYGVDAETAWKTWNSNFEYRKSIEDPTESIQLTSSRPEGRLSPYVRRGQRRWYLPNSIIAFVHRFIAELAEQGATPRQLEAARRLLTSYDTWAFLAGDSVDSLGETDSLALVRRMADALRVAAGLSPTGLP